MNTLTLLAAAGRRGRATLGASLALVCLLLLPVTVRGSDHADPIDFPTVVDLFGDGGLSAAATERLIGGLTDLFVFPLGADGKILVFPREPGASPALTDAERSQIRALGVILNARRALSTSKPLPVSPYTYRIHFDLHSPIAFRGDADQARYGGTILEPEQLDADVVIELNLNDDLTLRQKKIVGLANPDSVTLYTGLRDDPFIFPPFFGTNSISMVLTIPIENFPATQRNWIAWGTSSKDGKQVDHDGRSLRTQQPRFELFNKIPPKEHVAALRREIAKPSFARDLAVRVGFNSFFQYRPWDLVPDVVIYSTRFNVGFPNGRRLTDDVSALLAVNGDTLLYELSFVNNTWPRKTTNDKEFSDTFPWLADPWPDQPPKPGPALSPGNKWLLAGLLAVGAVTAVLALVGAWHTLRWLFGRRHTPAAAA